MHCAFSRDCEARRPHHDSKFSLFLSLLCLSSRCTLALLQPPLSICHPGFLRPLAFSTNGHNYVHVPIHNPHRQPPDPSSTKCTTTRSSVYSRCSHPIPHLLPPRDSIRAVVVRRLPLPRFSRPSRFFPIRCPPAFLPYSLSLPPSLRFFSSLPARVFLFYNDGRRVELKGARRYRNSFVDELSSGAKRDIVYGYVAARFLKLSSGSRAFTGIRRG